MSREERELTTDPTCRLRGTHSVYVADGASFPSLPSANPTFTFMANADRVGCVVRDRLQATRVTVESERRERTGHEASG